MSVTISTRQESARCKTTGKRIKPRRLVVQPMESTAITNPVLAVRLPGRLFNFKGTVNGAIVGRFNGSAGEHVRVYNPTTQRWENYPIKDFERDFFKLTESIDFGAYAVMQDVFNPHAGVDYCSEWDQASANTAIRIITPN